MDGISRQVLPENFALEVILVDSGSTDSTVAIARSMGVKIISIEKEEFSFGRALNIGCKAAKGEVLLFASAHVYPIYKDWIQRLCTPFQNPEVGLVYGRQEGNEITRFSEHQVFLQWFPTKSNLDQNTPFCNNANCAIRKSLWLDQPYNEELTGLEDLDWAEKMLSKGHKIVYEAEASIIHVHEESYARIRNRYEREAIAMKKIMPQVHFNSFDFLHHFIRSVRKDSAVAFKQGNFLREFEGILRFRYNQYKGTYRGHNQKGEIGKELKNRFYYPVSARKLKSKKTLDSDHLTRKIDYS
jgi:rhamnosyltransferase